MDVVARILAASCLVLLCVLAGAFIWGIHSSMMDAWRAYRDHNPKIDRRLLPISEDPLWVAVTATVFAVFFYGLVILALWVVIS